MSMVITPAGIFQPEYNYQADDVILSVAACVCGLTGIFIWLGYRFRWKVGRFPIFSVQRFWMLSFGHHLAWTLILPFIFSFGTMPDFWDSFFDFWFIDGPLFLQLWIVINLLIAATGFFFDGEESDREAAVPL